MLFCLAPSLCVMPVLQLYNHRRNQLFDANEFLIIQEAVNQDDDPLKKLQGAKIVKCRVCKGDHWTTKCPYKDSLQPLQQKEQEEKGLLHENLYSTGKVKTAPVNLFN